MLHENLMKHLIPKVKWKSQIKEKRRKNSECQTWGPSPSQYEFFWFFHPIFIGKNQNIFGSSIRVIAEMKM